MGFQIAGQPDADKVLDEYPFAVVLGMMLDQQYGMEHAFRGGWKVLSRFGTLDPRRSRRLTRGVQGDVQPSPRRSIGSPARWRRLQELAALSRPGTTVT